MDEKNNEKKLTHIELIDKISKQSTRDSNSTNKSTRSTLMKQLVIKYLNTTVALWGTKTEFWIFLHHDEGIEKIYLCIKDPWGSRYKHLIKRKEKLLG